MKKFFVAVAVLFGIGNVMVFADNVPSCKEAVVAVNASDPIEINDLPEAVQEALKQLPAEVTVKSATVEEKDGAKIYNVLVADKDGNEMTVSFDEEGKLAMQMPPMDKEHKDHPGEPQEDGGDQEQE